MEDFEKDIQHCLSVLHNGGLILYPTDSAWSIGCDATNEAAVQRLLQLVGKPVFGSMVVLMADEREVLQWVAAPDLAVFDFVASQQSPTTVLFEHALGLAEHLLEPDGSVCIQLVQDLFCRHLIKRFRKPLVGAPIANPAPTTLHDFASVPPELQQGVDYLVHWRRHEQFPKRETCVLRWRNGTAEWI